MERQIVALGGSFPGAHPQIDELTNLASAFPDGKIVLNHCGGPVGINAYRHKDVFPGWKKSIEGLAKRPNVCVKLGGLGMRIGGFGFETLADPPSSQALADAFFKGADIQKLPATATVPHNVELAVYLGSDYAAAQGH